MFSYLIKYWLQVEYNSKLQVENIYNYHYSFNTDVHIIKSTMVNFVSFEVYTFLGPTMCLKSETYSL